MAMPVPGSSGAPDMNYILMSMLAQNQSFMMQQMNKNIRFVPFAALPLKTEPEPEDQEDNV